MGNKCEVSDSFRENVMTKCKCSVEDRTCTELNIDDNLHTVSCDTTASQECRTAVVDWANAFRSAPNAIDCEELDPHYLISQDASKSCKE